MAAEESLIHLLHLFDSLWFDNQIPIKNSNTPFVRKVENENDQPKLARILTCADQNDDRDQSILITTQLDRILYSNTTSQESLSSGDSDNLLSPNSVLMRSPAATKLETILSEKESSESVKEKQEQKKVIIISEKNSTTRKMMRSRKRKGKGGLSSKSFSELEFEEVKGFMDLGFVFSEGDKNSSLVKIIPGLQRFGERDKEKDQRSIHNANDSLIRRPYLSQAWEIMEYKRKESAEKKIKWKINAVVLDNEMDMKHQLRFWAQSVASAVK